MNSEGQISLEYLFIFMIVLLIFSLISIPTLIESIENIDDAVNVIECKNALIQISNEVKLIYYSDIGTKKVKSINIPHNMKLEYKLYGNKHYLSTNIVLNDNGTKNIMVEVPCKVSFKNNPTYYYSSLYKRWYYNVEFKWIKNNEGYNVDVNFK